MRPTSSIALEKIAELENLTVTEEEITAEYDRIASAYGIEVEQVKSFVEHDSVEADMKVAAAMKLVKEKAVVTAKA